MGETWWEALRGLFNFASQAPFDLDGLSSCFELCIDRDGAVFCQNSVLVRATVLQSLQATLQSGVVTPLEVDHPSRKVLLRMSLTDWATLGAHCDKVRALWTQVRVVEEVVILDTTCGPAFLAGDVALRNDSMIQMAEIFSGGFAGWMQAAWSLQDAGVALRTSWMLDVEDEVRTPLETFFPALQTVQSAPELEDVADTTDPVLLLANFEHDWWLKAWAAFPPDLVACSPPCQPWSTAGFQSGLESPDGRLILRLIAILQVVRVPVVCLEEVTGFLQHADFPTVMQAWDDAGYVCIFREELQLAEVAPTWRKRLLMIFAHKQRVPEACHVLTFQPWVPHPRPSLSGMRAHFNILPADLLKSCEVGPDVLAKYLDPWFLPPGVRTDPASVQRFRLANPTQQARTFMAAYHRQHDLPVGMLERRGLLCSLLQVSGKIRFFSAPEIASCHGAQQMHLIVADDARSMTTLGNALAVPQAALTLAHALRCFPEVSQVAPAAAVRIVLENRLHAGNTGLFRVNEGWLLVRADKVGAALARAHLRSQIEGLMCSVGQVFHEIHLGEWLEEQVFETAQIIPFTSHLTLDAALRFLDLPLPTQLPPALGVGPAFVYQVGVSALPIFAMDAPAPSLRLGGTPHRVFTAVGQFLCLSGTPDFFHQLKWIFDKCRLAASPGVACLSCFGDKYNDASELPQQFFVASDADHIYCHAPVFTAHQVEACGVSDHQLGLLLCIQPDCACEWAVRAPYHLFECVGWSLSAIAAAETEVGPGPSALDCRALHLLAAPLAEGPVASASTVRVYLRDLLYLAQLRLVTDGPQEGPFVLQVQNRTLLRTNLPAALTPASVEQMWHRACVAAGCWPGAQVFSGPRRLDYESSLSQLLLAGAFHVQAATGSPILSILPETRGGGVRDENQQLAKGKMATLLLERGVPLPQTTVAVDSLLTAAGATSCLAAMSSTGSAAQWRQLNVLAKGVGQQLPVGDNRTERAAQRIQQAVRRRKLAQTAPVSARDFCLLEGTWCGIDDQSVPVLDSIGAEANGVILMEPSQANPQDLALLCNMGADALCVVVPGHCCPDPETCSGKASVPVTHRATGCKHLIAVCYHNVGETAITPFVEHGSQVELAGTVCCVLSMYRDECPSEIIWQEAVQAPVRTVAQAFKTKGLANPFSHPWGRTFRANGRPSQPAHCDAFLFQAKVDESSLRPLLRLSGFNKVYVVPKGWNRSVLEGWSVVWLSAPRGDVERQAALIPEQHGLVRGKGRFGIRVPTRDFDRLFRQLRPGATVPESFDVRALYKIGPLPPDATADAVMQWSKQLHWPVRIIKTLGPQFWLVGAPTAPPAETLTFNKTPVLVTSVKGRDTPQPVVQAGGPLPSGTTKSQPAEASDPWLLSDPWSTYRAKQSPSPSAPAAGPTPAAAVALRATAAQVQSQVQSQENRLASLENSLKDLRNDQEAAARERAADKQRFHQDLATVRSEVQGLGHGLRQQIQTQMDTYTAAQKQHEQQMNAGMAELKALLLTAAESRKARKLPDEDL
eukprot:s1792_g7.t1